MHETLVTGDGYKLHLLVLDDDLDFVPARNGVKGVLALAQREDLCDELFEIHHATSEQVDGIRETRRSVPRNA